jgi:putative peptidoglycan lipid II flippase
MCRGLPAPIPADGGLTMFRSVRVLLFGGIVGKVLGVARELVFAWLFGTGGIAAAFRLAQSAFLIPLQGLVSEAINSAFIPLFAAERVRDRNHAAAIFNAMHLALAAISIVVAVALFAFAAEVVRFLAPGFDASRLATACTLLRGLSCAMPLYILSALYGAVQLAAGGGQLLAARASLQSLGLLAGASLAWYLQAPIWLAAGFFIAYLYLSATGMRFVLAQGLPMSPRRAFNRESAQALNKLWRIFRILIWIPIAIQLNSVVERQTASVTDVHAMAALDYAKFINETLIILLAMPFGLAGLSGLAHVEADEARALQVRALRMLLYAGVPLGAAIQVHSLTIVQVLFQRGAFGVESSQVTSTILETQALGIWAQLIGYAGTKFLAARGQARLALVATALGVGVSIATLLLGAQAFGPRVLGLASAAQGFVFGMTVLWLLGVLKALSADMVTLALVASAYLGLMAAASRYGTTNVFLLVPLTLAYWGIALAAMPGSRRMLAVLTSRLPRNSRFRQSK